MFEALFHRAPANLLTFSRAAAAAGMDPIPPRPGLLEGRAGRNRDLATRLSSIARLWTLLGGADGRAQAFYRAAREIGRASHDFVALAREGNLGLFEWMSPECGREIESYSDAPGSGLLEVLLERLRASEELPSG